MIRGDFFRTVGSFGVSRDYIYFVKHLWCIMEYFNNTLLCRKCSYLHLKIFQNKHKNDNIYLQNSNIGFFSGIIFTKFKTFLNINIISAIFSYLWDALHQNMCKIYIKKKKKNPTDLKNMFEYWVVTSHVISCFVAIEYRRQTKSKKTNNKQILC